MITKKQIIIISFVFALLFHLVFHFDLYGPTVSLFKSYPKYVLALASALMMIFVYIATYWRIKLKGSSIVIWYDILIVWTVICIIRSLLTLHGREETIDFIFSSYLGISLFPVLFFIAGLNVTYFRPINSILVVYLILASLISFSLINYFELQVFLLYPLFFMILTIPLQKTGTKWLIFLVSLAVVLLSFTNRAGVLRIIISYCILLVYFIMTYIKINKKLLYTAAFLILMIPVISLYMGIKGQSVFQMILGEDNQPYSQLNLYSDTRTFLYFEVFQDLKANNAFILGKGIGAGYYSGSFTTYNRDVVEVGFLQILLKTGIIGFLLYVSIIISAVFKALGKSKNQFIKSVGLMLAGYLLMFFVENILAYNALNVLVWIAVGMCHSDEYRNMTDEEIRNYLRRNGSSAYLKKTTHLSEKE